MNAAAAPPVPNSSKTYQVYPFFTGTDNQPNNAVFVLPPNFTKYGGATNFKITGLYLGGANFASYTYANTDFSFALTQSGTSGPYQSNVQVSITLLGANMWKAAPTARKALMASFADFVQNIETQFELKGVLVPGAAYIIGQQVADNIPAPPVESLFYRFSLSPSTQSVPYVDVRPGTRLRLQTQISQYLTPSSPQNGYVSAGSVSMSVNSMPAAQGRNVAFDTFLGTIQSPNISNGATSPPFIAGGLIDLQPIAAARPHVRLFYPTSIPANTEPGDVSMLDNVALMAAQTLASLAAATTAFPQPATATPPNVYTIFLGRAIVIPEIPVWISARGATTLEWVAVGTTVSHIVERFTTLPYMLTQGSNTTNPVVNVTRTTSINLGGPAYAQFSWTTNMVGTSATLPAYAPALFDIPLIPGDTIALTV